VFDGAPQAVASSPVGPLVTSAKPGAGANRRSIPNASQFLAQASWDSVSAAGEPARASRSGSYQQAATGHAVANALADPQRWRLAMPSPKGSTDRGMAIPAPEHCYDSARHGDRSREPPRAQRCNSLSIQAPALSSRPEPVLLTSPAATDPSFRRPGCIRTPSHTRGIQCCQGKKLRPSDQALPSAQPNFHQKTIRPETAEPGGSPFSRRFTINGPLLTAASTTQIAGHPPAAGTIADAAFG